VYRTPEWKRLRDRVIYEEPVCYIEGCSNPSREADHIEPVHKREDLALVRSNVRGICREHHRTRSSKQGAEASKSQRRKES
jgi:hypothetical protein